MSKEVKESEEIILKVGNDNGNSEHDIIINNILINQPNVYARVGKLPNLDEVDKQYVLDNLKDNLIITYDGGKYYIGKYALKSGQRVRNMEVGIDNNKVESDVVRINTVGQIAGAAIKERYKNASDITDETLKVKVDMTTALPVSYYTGKLAQEFADIFMKDKHIVVVNIGNIKVPVEIKFEFVKVIPEGVDATFALRQDDKYFEEYNKQNKDGKLTKEFFATCRCLHVAIGEGTTEYPITQGIKFDPEFINGSDNGIGIAIDTVNEEFKKQKGLTKFTRQDYSRVIRDEAHKYYELAIDLVEPSIEDQAIEILSHIKQEIQKANNEVDIVCIYGGGSILMRKYLEKKVKAFCDRADISLLYIPAKYAVNIEAEGLYNFTNSNIFTALKSRYNK